MTKHIEDFSPEDIFVFFNNTSCYRKDFHERYGYDFEVIYKWQDDRWEQAQENCNCRPSLIATCGSCIYYTGEECNGPGGSSEGSVVYDDTLACDCYEEYTPTYLTLAKMINSKV